MSGKEQWAATSSTRCSKEAGVVDFVEGGGNRVGGAAMAAARYRRSRTSPAWSFALPSGSSRRRPRGRAAQRRIALPTARRGQPGDQRSSRSVEKAEDVAKLDIGVSVMSVVVLGQHEPEGARGRQRTAAASSSRDRWYAATRRGAGLAPGRASAPCQESRQTAAATARYGRAPRAPSSRTAGSRESTAWSQYDRRRS